MKFSLKLVLALTLLSMILFQWNLRSDSERTVIPLHFVKGLNGKTILANVDHLIATRAATHTLSRKASHPQKKITLSLRQKFAFTDASIQPKAESSVDTNEDTSASEDTESDSENDLPLEGDSSKDLTAIHPLLGNLWNNTVMIFGASADGIGVGTGFAINQIDENSAFFVTNFHVVDHFCKIPHDLVSDQVSPDDLKYVCQSLFVLHDVAINTQTHQTTVDGSQPWKSEVNSLVFFDRKLDLAVFKVSTPSNFTLKLKIEIDYDLKKPVFDKKEAQLTQGNSLKKGMPTVNVPLTSFDLYLISYSVPTANDNQDTLIKKSWHKGKSDGVRAFETDSRLGLISALKHTIEMKPGSSGGPLALSDGRIVGINESLEMNQFFANSGCSREELETYLSYYAIPTVFLKPILNTQN